MERMTEVILERKWSDWEAGDVVTLPHAKALRVVAKNYGRIKKPTVKRVVKRGPAPKPEPVEPEPNRSDDAEPVSEPIVETTEITPVKGRTLGRRRKGGK